MRSLAICCLLGVLTANALRAQLPFSRWIVQSGDSLNDQINGDVELVRLMNGDLLNCACRDVLGTYAKCRFLRLSSTGDPLQQWEVNASSGSFWLNKVIENDDGSFACFGRYGYASLYLHLDPMGSIITAKSYEVTGIGIVAPFEWNDAVEDPGGRFTLAGEWYGMGHNAMMARIEADGTLITHNLIELGTQGLTFFNSLARLANGDHVFCGASNYPGDHCKTYLFKTDSVLTPLWAKAYPDSGYVYTYPKLLMSGVQYRILLRERDPGFIGSTLMVAAASNGNPIWGKRRLPDPDYPSMTLWPKTAHLTTGGSIAMAGTQGGAGNGAFVQVLTTNGDELGLVEVDIPTPLAGCAGDAGSMYFGGFNHGPLGLGAYSFGLTKIGSDLALCGEVQHATTEELWFPSMDTTWSQTAVPVTVTDVLPQFTSYPTTAYMVPICLTTDQDEEPDASEDPVIFPNPTDGRLTIRASDIREVVIVDATGRRVLERSYRNTDQVTLEVEHLSRGSYVIEVKSAVGARRHRLVRE